MPSALRRLDYEDYLVYLIFGSDGDVLQRCLRRAYLDFSRTLHGVGQGRELYEDAARMLKERIEAIQHAHISTQDQFDKWHRGSCDQLVTRYRSRNYSFFIGQAQKWLNMTFKYIYVLGQERIPGYGHLYNFCHVPLDNILLKALERYKFEPLPCAWSRLESYDVYLDRQQWLRNFFSQVPLDIEFNLWMERPLTTDLLS